MIFFEVGSELGLIDVYDIRDLSKPTVTFKLHDDAVHRLSFSNTEPGLLAAASDDTTISVTLIAGSCTSSM